MIAQSLFDELADALVARGRQASYTNIRAALIARRGTATSDRDLQGPYADWTERRKYKAHLALLDLPVDMEKLLAKFARAAMLKGEVVADARNAELVARIAELERELGESRERSRILAAEALALRAAPAPAEPVPAPEAARPRGRKVGISGATSRFFWNRVTKELAHLIEREGPRHLDELVASIGPQERALAAAAFRPIDAVVLKKTLGERTGRQRHGLTRLSDGRYGGVHGGR